MTENVLKQIQDGEFNIDKFSMSSIQPVYLNDTDYLEAQLKTFVFASIISADNDRLEEDVKQEIIRRYDDHKKTGDRYDNWEFILDPIEDDDLRTKYLNMLD